MDLLKCKVCKNHFEHEDLEFIDGNVYCYSCVKQCKNCDNYHNFYGDYCYSCLEGDLV